MKISVKETKRIAHWARLGLEAKEVDKFSKELSAILDYVEELNKVKTKDVETTSHATGLVNALRKDNVYQADITDEILDNAPVTTNKSIKVKSVFEE